MPFGLKIQFNTEVTENHRTHREFMNFSMRSILYFLGSRRVKSPRWD